MREDDDDEAAPIIEPVEQRLVTLLEDDEVLAARTESDIYLPIRPLCAALGLAFPPQSRRIRQDEVLAESVHSLRLKTRGGSHVLLCLDLEAVSLWLAGIERSRVREELRERLRIYKRWVRTVVYEAFARETGMATAVGASAGTAVHTVPDALSLEQVERLGLAIATLARQQRALEQHIDERFLVVDERVGTLHEAVGSLDDHQELITGRLDQAAAVVGRLLGRIDALEQTIAPGQVISDAQAAEVSALVKALATEMAAQDKRAGRSGSHPYQSVFAELYRRFRVSSYHNIPAHRFPAVMAWLRAYQDARDAPGEHRTDD